MKYVQVIGSILVTITIIFNLSCGETPEKVKTEQQDSNIEETHQESSQEEISEIDSSTLLSRISSKLSSAKTIRVNIETGYDVMQDIGQKLEFGDTREVYIERPENILIRIRERQGNVHQFIYNGQTINYSSPGEKVYGEVALEGNIEDAIEYFTNELQTHIPLSELFSVKLKETLDQKVTSSAIIDLANIKGTKTHHIAMRTEEVDAQIWADLTTDLPSKIIITYKNEPGQPQFWAVFNGWEIDQPIDPSNFVTNNEGFQKIRFIPVHGG